MRHSISKNDDFSLRLYQQLNYEPSGPLGRQMLQQLPEQLYQQLANQLRWKSFQQLYQQFETSLSQRLDEFGSRI
jgi:hypothetical protein